jgi:hypothetical protein
MYGQRSAAAPPCPPAGCRAPMLPRVASAECTDAESEYSVQRAGEAAVGQRAARLLLTALLFEMFLLLTSHTVAHSRLLVNECLTRHSFFVFLYKN